MPAPPGAAGWRDGPRSGRFRGYRRRPSPVSTPKIEVAPMSARLRILLIGASGVLGRAIVAELSPRHDIISAGSKTGDIRIDIADPASIEAALKSAGPLDAVASAAGAVNFHPLSAIKPVAARRVVVRARACQQADGPGQSRTRRPRPSQRRRVDYADGRRPVPDSDRLRVRPPAWSTRRSRRSQWRRRSKCRAASASMR